ncbi:MAG: helix-turn-helix domain-containing protein [Proteobacteria bacterium]|nr:helix-turn-helix domain-containing protein [Pseudomonadota bacterium]
MDDEGKVIVKSIGKAMQFWRKLEGLDQKEFSDKIGTSRSYVAKLENGHVGVSLGRIAEIADALGVSPYTLMHGMPDNDELDILLDLYADRELEITKSEMETLFCQRFINGSVPAEYFEHILCIERGGSYRCANGKKKK